MNLFLNILQIISILGIVCVVLVLVISYVENRKLVITEYNIQSLKVPKAFHGYHIVHLTDMHNACFGEENSLLIDKVRNLQPDIIIVTGDMIIGKPGRDVCFAADTMNNLSDIAPVYFSMGNHELRASIYTDTYSDMWETFRKRLSNKIHLLFDNKETICKQDQEIHLYGLNLSPELYRRMIKTPMDEHYLSDLFGACDDSEFHIFLAHNPDYFEEYVKWGADLVFAGHVHGGMLRLPFLGGALSPMIHFFPKYDKGLFKIMDKHMVLSGGLGNHTFKFRVNNLPEIVSVTLYQK